MSDGAGNLVKRFNELSGSSANYDEAMKTYQSNLEAAQSIRDTALKGTKEPGTNFYTTTPEQIAAANAAYSATVNKLNEDLAKSQGTLGKDNEEIKKIEAQLALIEAKFVESDTQAAWGSSIGDLKDFSTAFASGKYQGVTAEEKSSIQALVNQLTSAWANNSPIKTYSININGSEIKTIDDPTDLIMLIEQLSRSKRVAV